MPSAEQIQAIRDHLDSRPGVYLALSDAEAANVMNQQSETRVKAEFSGRDVYALTNQTEFSNLTEAQKGQWLAFCSIDTFDPANGTIGAQLVQDLFGLGSQTLAALVAARTEAVSPAVLFVGIHRVFEADIAAARAL